MISCDHPLQVYLFSISGFHTVSDVTVETHLPDAIEPVSGDPKGVELQVSQDFEESSFPLEQVQCPLLVLFRSIVSSCFFVFISFLFLPAGSVQEKKSSRLRCALLSLHICHFQTDFHDI